MDASSLTQYLDDTDPFMGMGIERVDTDGDAIRVQTLGTVVTIDRDGTLTARQRIGVERDVLRIRLHERFAPWRIGRQTGFQCTLEGNGLTIRVQGDSVLVFTPQQNMTLTFDGCYRPAYNQEAKGNRLLLDEQGGCGFFGFPARPTELAETGDAWSLRCHLARWDEMWVSVCPPRHANPAREAQSVSHDILYYLMRDDEMSERYPSETTLKETARYCQILALHEEIWKDAPDWVEDPPGANYEHPKPWETDRHLPYEEAAFAQMRDQAQALGMKVVPYCSPYYSNAPDIFAEMDRVLAEYKMDGLYFDGWCGMRDDFRTQYAMIRKARAILGDRIMYLHSSGEPYGPPGVYPPFVFAYADFCLRGESGRGDLDLDSFLRYTVSGRQISNSVGMWCYYGSTGESGYHFNVPTTEHIHAAHRNRVHLWRQSRMWRNAPEELARFDREYYGGRR
ncbi:MAG: hypothetical protein GY851_15225 [bacterium]|nr:hypothetical protein [bacterium]